MWILAGLLGLFSANFFATQAITSNTGVNLAGGVYLNPNTGRFWSMDSYLGSSQDPMSLHKYLYAHANPVNGWDPSGHYTLVEKQVTMFLMVLGVLSNSWNLLSHINTGDYAALKWDVLGIAMSLAGGWGGGGGLSFAPASGATVPFAVNFSKGAILTVQGAGVTLGGAGLVTAMNRTTPPEGSPTSPPGEGGTYPNQMPDELAGELKWIDEAGIKPAQAGTAEFWKMLHETPVVKWAVTKDGNLGIVPFRINLPGRTFSKEIPHTAITRGVDACAGEASLIGDTLHFNKLSGHYRPGNYSAGELAFKATKLNVKYVPGKL